MKTWWRLDEDLMKMKMKMKMKMRNELEGSSHLLNFVEISDGWRNRSWEQVAVHIPVAIRQSSRGMKKRTECQLVCCSLLISRRGKGREEEERRRVGIITVFEEVWGFQSSLGLVLRVCFHSELCLIGREEEWSDREISIMMRCLFVVVFCGDEEIMRE